ncbi:MAG: sulfite exporter TauE/SafE family protein [Actinomycetota bacterium]|nr:sulfite exporter TauE/SafE family protein [Actinomycetota bacterium]
MDLSAVQIAAGLVVGLAIGLTGVGGGALLTPIVVILLGVPPAAAVSSDVVVSLAVKPVGSAVHMRHGSTRLDITKWLVIGSVPAAFSGVLLLQLIGDNYSDAVKPALGVALVVAAVALVSRAFITRRRAHLLDETAGEAPGFTSGATPTSGTGGTTKLLDPVTRRSPVRPIPTLVVGALGGLLVGLTSVGAGSLMLVLLTVLYPRLTTAELVGTDLVQAVPLVASAAVGHLLFGQVQFDLATSLIIGALPGVYVGARLSSRAPDRVTRPILATLLAASGLKLMGIA